MSRHYGQEPRCIGRRNLGMFCELLPRGIHFVLHLAIKLAATHESTRDIGRLQASALRRKMK
jgi:hypothetical protein